jgi:hypothetical protein
VLWAAVLGPLRQHDGQARAAVEIRIAVEGDVEPFVAGILDQSQHARGAATAGSALVEMRDVHRNVALASDVEGLLERIQKAVTQAVAHVRMIDTAQAHRLAAQLDQFGGVGIAAGRVVQAGGEPESALLHAFAQHRSHVGHFGSARTPVLPAHAADTHRRVTEDIGYVHRHLVAKHVEILLDRGPLAGQRRVTVQAGVHFDEAVEVVVRHERRIGAAVDTDQLGGHALAHLGLMVRLGQHDQARMGVHVDEARTDDEPCGVDHPRRLHVPEIATHDAHGFALDTDGAIKSRIASTVDNHAIADQEV